MAYSHSRYGHCDTYFEDSEDGIFAYRRQERERQAAIARMHQRVLDEKISQVTADEYKTDVLRHMEHMEAETMPDVSSIDIQTEIQWFMRPYLLDFLIEAHSAFQLLPDTLYLAVNLLDRYCSRRVVYKRHYQLVGCASLLIAAKYANKKENVPTIRELKSMCCGLYDEEMFTQMEWHVLQTLDWVIGHPTVDAFLDIALDETDDHQDREVEHMTQYFCEIALFSKEFISVLPSVMARSALALARCILNRQSSQSPWAGSYDQSVVVHLSHHLYQPSVVLSRKYASMSLSSVSTILEDFLRKQAQASQPEQHYREPVPRALVTPIEQHKHDPFAAPHTPQKGTYGVPAGSMHPMMNHGALTPPDTPEDGKFVDMTNAHAPMMVDMNHQQQTYTVNVNATKNPYLANTSFPPTPTTEFDMQPAQTYAHQYHYPQPQMYVQ